MVFEPGTKVEILERGEWKGTFTVTGKAGRDSEHIVLSGPYGLFEIYNDAPFNIRTVKEG